MLTEAAIREATDPQSFTRGQAYFASGHVRKLAIEGSKVTARVDGTAAYRVKLVLTKSGLTGECSCPYDTFCKHCVATAFAWLRKGGKPTTSAPKPVVDLEKFLLAQKRSWLTDQLMQAASADPLLLARLEVAAGADARSAYDSSALRERLERVIDAPAYVDYHEAGTYFENVDDVIDEVAAVAESFPDVAIDVVEYALELLEDAVERIEDMDGVESAIGRLEEIHFAACSAGNPDPVELATRLASRALDSQCDVFATVLPDYAPIFGPEGVARYRELVEKVDKSMRSGLMPRNPFP